MIKVLGEKKGRWERMREKTMLLGREKNQEFSFGRAVRYMSLEFLEQVKVEDMDFRVIRILDEVV